MVGYGFLSENTMFVAELEKAGVKFIGENFFFVNLYTDGDLDLVGSVDFLAARSGSPAMVIWTLVPNEWREFYILQ